MASRIHGTMREERERKSERGREERGIQKKTERAKRTKKAKSQNGELNRKGKLGKRGRAQGLEMFRVGVGVRSSERSPNSLTGTFEAERDWWPESALIYQ